MNGKDLLILALCLAYPILHNLFSRRLLFSDSMTKLVPKIIDTLESQTSSIKKRNLLIVICVLYVC